MLTIKNDTNGAVLMSLLLIWTYFTPCSSVSIVKFEQVNGWHGLTYTEPFGLKRTIVSLAVKPCNI